MIDSRRSSIDGERTVRSYCATTPTRSCRTASIAARQDQHDAAAYPSGRWSAFRSRAGKALAASVGSSRVAGSSKPVGQARTGDGSRRGAMFGLAGSELVEGAGFEPARLSDRFYRPAVSATHPPLPCGSSAGPCPQAWPDRNWRTGRDSNPRGGETPTRFPDVRLEPLGHLSCWLADGAGFEPAAPLARRSRSATGSVRPLRHPSLMRPAGRGGRIRTGDLRSPRPARYLAAPRPVGADDPGRGRPTRTGGLRAPDASLCLLSYTPEACRRRSAVSLEHAADQLPMFSVDGRGGRIRTGGLRVPNAALCQAELRPVR